MKDKKYFIYMVAWTLIIIVGVLAASNKAYLNRERFARMPEHKQKLDFCAALGEEVSHSIIIAFQQGMPIEDFKKKFGELIPDETEDDNKSIGQKYIYYHPQSQHAFSLRFEDGALRGIGGDINNSIETSVIINSPEYLLSEEDQVFDYQSFPHRLGGCSGCNTFSTSTQVNTIHESIESCGHMLYWLVSCRALFTNIAWDEKQ